MLYGPHTDVRRPCDSAHWNDCSCVRFTPVSGRRANGRMFSVAGIQLMVWFSTTGPLGVCVTLLNVAKVCVSLNRNGR
jgi:hypothetical protein